MKYFNPNQPPSRDDIHATTPPIPPIQMIDEAIRWYRAHKPAQRADIDHYLRVTTGTTITRLYMYLNKKES